MKGKTKKNKGGKDWGWRLGLGEEKGREKNQEGEKWMWEREKDHTFMFFPGVIGAQAPSSRRLSADTQTKNFPFFLLILHLQHAFLRPKKAFLTIYRLLNTQTNKRKILRKSPKLILKQESKLTSQFKLGITHKPFSFDLVIKP